MKPVDGGWFPERQWKCERKKKGNERWNRRSEEGDGTGEEMGTERGEVCV